MSAPAKLFADFPPVSNEAWEAAIVKDLKGGDPKKLNWRTEEGIEVKPYYRRDTAAAGRAPVLRPGGGRWEIRAEIRESEPRLANAAARKLIEHGAPSVVFRRSVLESLNDVRTLLDGLPLERLPVHFDCIPGSMKTLEMLEKLPKSHELSGSVTCDPIAEMIEDDAIGADIFPEAAVRFQNARRLMPRVLPLVVRGERYHNAGATVVQELALALAAGAEYVTQLSARDIAAVEVAENLGFAFATGSSYFLEIAKFRAMRLLWARVLGAFEDASTAPARIFARTSEWNQTVYDRYNNLLRGTTEAIAAIIGGCDAVTVRPYTGPWQPADDDSMRWALNTQFLLREEAYFDKVSDPAAGSWYIEELTDKVAQEAWKQFQDLESEGGLVRCLEKGIVQNMVRAARENRETLIAERRKAFVGTNQYPNPKERIEIEVESPEGGHQPLARTRGPWAFEKIRLATDHADHRPKVLLLLSGDGKMKRARAEFSTNFFACAGFEIVRGEKLEDATDADLVVLCSSDPEYPALAKDVCARSKAPVIVAGYPKDALEELKATGVVDFIHMRSNAAQTLARWQKKLGVVAEEAKN